MGPTHRIYELKLHGKGNHMEKNLIVVSDCRDAVLRGDVWESSDDYSLFHITQARSMGNKAIFDDCTFVNLFIDDKTEWGAPIPSTFQCFFEEILKSIASQEVFSQDHLLVLNVVDYISQGYFDQDLVIREFVKPNNYLHFFLAKEIDGIMTPTLFFECPIDRISILSDIAFPGTVTDVDGFFIERSKTSLFQDWARMGNTDTMFRDLIRNVFFAFGTWADHNGMFLVTDKFDISALRRNLSSSALETKIRDYINLEDDQNPSRRGQAPHP